MINIILNTTNNDETSSEIVSRLLIPFQDKNILIGPGEVLLVSKMVLALNVSIPRQDVKIFITRCFI